MHGKVFGAGMQLVILSVSGALQSFYHGHA